jgi:hypothetical protein
MRIVLKSAPPKIDPPVLLKIEHGVNLDKDILNDLSNEMTKGLLDCSDVPSAIEFISPGVLGSVTKNTHL